MELRALGPCREPSPVAQGLKARGVRTENEPRKGGAKDSAELHDGAELNFSCQTDG